MRVNINKKVWAIAGKWLKVQKAVESAKTTDEKIKALEEFYKEANKNKRLNRYYIGTSSHYLADLYRSDKKGFVKVEIALAKGRRQYDKKQKIKEKDIKREVDRELKYYKG